MDPSGVFNNCIYILVSNIVQNAGDILGSSVYEMFYFTNAPGIYQITLLNINANLSLSHLA